MIGQQPNDHHQALMHSQDPAAQPPQRPGQLDGIRAQRIRHGLKAWRLLRGGHDLFELAERTGQPRRQAVRQRTEREVTLGAQYQRAIFVPAGLLHS